MGHEAVQEAAVIAIADPKWQERPLAVVVLKDGAKATAEELRLFSSPSSPNGGSPTPTSSSSRSLVHRLENF